MSTTIDLYPAPIRHDLTPDALAELPAPGRPIVPGDTWDQVFRVVDADGEAVDITGAKVVLSVKRRGVVLFDRDTDTATHLALSGTPTDGTFTVKFRPADEALLLANLGLSEFDIRIKYASGAIETRAQGAFVVTPTSSPNSQIPT